MTSERERSRLKITWTKTQYYYSFNAKHCVVSDVTQHCLIACSVSTRSQKKVKTWSKYSSYDVEVSQLPQRDPRDVLCFYRAMLCIRGTSHGPVSVSVSVSVCVCLSQVGVLLKRLNIGSHKQHRTIPQRTLVFWCQRSPRNSTGVTPYEGAKCRLGGSKSATFD